MTTQTQDRDQERAMSVEAERRVLGACLMATPSYDPVADVARAVREGDWCEPAHELVWSAVQRLHGASRPTGVPAVEAQLRSTGDLERAGGLVGLSRLASEACSPAEAGHYADLVHGYAQVRRYQQALVRGMQGARQADPLAVQETIAAHQAELEHLAADDQDEDDTFGRFGDHLDAHLDSLAVSLPPAAITGFSDLDSRMKLMPGQMIVVAARPAMGKSAFALGVATANARTGAPTLVHSLEMGRAEVSNRILSARARVAFHHIRDGVDGLTQDDWDRLDRYAPELKDLPLWMDYSARVSPARIRSRIKTIVRETGRAPLVVVDYLQLMQTDQRNARQSPYERVTEISRELKILASDTGAVLIALAQLNRGPEQRQDKRPAVSDLRDSGALEQDADAIILLHREDYYEPESERSGETDLIVAKHRNGPTATITVAHQFHYSRLRDMAATEEPAR
ncbi:replicative DNA helicase [Streptomyces glaucescens]|uniref:DNA 5'-3' helicase n=1 Tax=Streptomyces glaucescens TaxID=1907 RepID=A0A089XEP4_STRGA|nr:DnaB-like helicase C-terminal domain-containing protein [Streptomyces glaucescens]AIS02438.1 Replicative DNA helicase [Streptomyces glaucescens]